MKTQVIQLDPHDDVISIRDKMSWAKTPRILLVFPRQMKLRLRNLDLRLLRRHAEHLGAQVAFVTRSRWLRRTAREEGLPTFPTVSHAQRKPWSVEAVSAPLIRQAPPADLWGMRKTLYSAQQSWQNLPVVRIAFFTVAVLAILLLLMLFLPSATIQLTPLTHIQELSISAVAAPEIASLNLSGSLPAHTLATFEEKSRTAPVSNRDSVPDNRASGTVRFRNLTGTAVDVPKGTIVRTTTDLAVRFETTADVNVPASGTKSGDAPIQAMLGGKSGNVLADSLVAIEGELGTRLAVTNPEPVKGGTDKQVLLPTEVDRTHLREILEAEILKDCQATFKKIAPANALFFPDTLKAGQVISEVFFPPAGQPGDTLSLTLNLQCQGQYADPAEIETLAAIAMNVNLPAGFETPAEPLITWVADVPKTDADGSTRWTLRASRLVRAHIERTAAVELVQGRTPSAATARLQTALPLAQAPLISLQPAWVPWLPLFPFRITVLVQ